MTFRLLSSAVFDGDDYLSLAACKPHLRIEDGNTDEDDLIEALRDAAIDWVEGFTGLALVAREFVATGTGFGDGRLPRRPVSAVASVGYLDGAGAALVVTAGDYRFADDLLLAKSGVSWPATLGEAGAVTVTFTAGLSAAGEAPALVAAVKMLLASLYANREGLIEGAKEIDVPGPVVTLCNRHKRMRVG